MSEADERPWAKMDLLFFENPKVVGLSDRTIVVHWAGILYCRRQRTDGMIPKAAVPQLRPITPAQARKAAGELVAAGLWEVNGAGYAVHDYEQWQLMTDAERRRSEHASKASRARWARAKADA